MSAQTSAARRGRARRPGLPPALRGAGAGVLAAVDGGVAAADGLGRPRGLFDRRAPWSLSTDVLWNPPAPRGSDLPPGWRPPMAAPGQETPVPDALLTRRGRAAREAVAGAQRAMDVQMQRAAEADARQRALDSQPLAPGLPIPVTRGDAREFWAHAVPKFSGIVRGWGGLMDDLRDAAANMPGAVDPASGVAITFTPEHQREARAQYDANPQQARNEATEATRSWDDWAALHHVSNPTWDEKAAGFFGDVAPPVGTTLINPLLGAATGAGLANDEIYRRALAAGATPQQAREAALRGTLIATATNAITGERIAGSLLDRAASPLAVRWGLGVGADALAGGGGQVAQNYVEQQTFNPDRSLADDVWQAAAQQGLGSVLSAGRGARTRDPAAPEISAPAPASVRPRLDMDAQVAAWRSRERRPPPLDPAETAPITAWSSPFHTTWDPPTYTPPWARGPLPRAAPPYGAPEGVQPWSPEPWRPAPFDPLKAREQQQIDAWMRASRRPRR